MNLYTASLRRLLDDLGAGAAAWSVSRTASNGITAATSTAVGTRTLRVLRMTDPKLQALLAGWPHLTAEWYGIGAAGLDVYANDHIAAGDYSFGVTGADNDSWPGYTVLALKRLG